MRFFQATLHSGGEVVSKATKIQSEVYLLLAWLANLRMIVIVHLSLVIGKFTGSKFKYLIFSKSQSHNVSPSATADRSLNHHVSFLTSHLSLFLSIFCLLLSAFLWSEELPLIEYDNLAVGTEHTLEVMTWNIQNFPKHDFTISYAAGIINAIDADLIALQEIKSDSAFFALVYKLNELDNNNWSGFRANRNYWKHELAYIYKTEQIAVEAVYEIFHGDYQPFPRSPLVLKFQYAGQNIVIINNHFKAMPGAENAARRRDAVQKLDAWIFENHPDDNVIVLGDLNDHLTKESADNVFTAFLEKPDEYRFVDYEISANDSADWSYPYLKYRGHLDHILISNELFDEFESADEFVKVVTIDKFMEGGDEARYKYITDHRPVVLKLQFESQE